MLAAGYGTVSDFEVFFLLASAVGLVFAIFNVKSLWDDFKFLKEQHRNRGTDSAYLLTKASLFNEAGRAFLQATFVYVAILSMRLPDPPAAIGLRNQIESAIARWAFLFGAIWVMAKTAYTWYIRKRVIEMNGNGNGGVH